VRFGTVSIHQAKGFRMKLSRKFALTTIALLAALGGTAQAQTAAASTQSTDPTVQMRMEKRDANSIYREASRNAQRARDAKVNAAVDKAVADAKAAGRDPQIARRDARAQARKETRPEYDAAMAAARKERDAARAAARQTGAGTQ
jgi:hypothetical protein